MKSGKAAWRGGGGNKKIFQYCTDSSGTILHLRALQGHSGRNLIDPTLQDNVEIPDGFFKYIFHVGCAINLHSIINSGLIPGGQNLSNRQTVFFLPVDRMDKQHKDPERIDLNAPRLAQYMHKAWKKHQNTVCWVDINLAQKKGLKFYQTRSNAIILYDTLQPIVSRKLFGWKLEKSHTKKYMCHLAILQWFPWNMIGRKNWVQKLLYKQKFPNQPNQIQIMKERGDPLFALRERPTQVSTTRLKHVLLVTVRASI